MKKKDEPYLTVVARAPFQIYYEGKAKVVSAANKVGTFDVLPGHADFFSVMSPGEVLIETDTETISIPTNSGIIGVRDDKVLLFINM